MHCRFTGSKLLKNLDSYLERRCKYNHSLKFEIRTTKFETNPKFQCSKVRNKIIRVGLHKLPFGSFEFWSLKVVSNFELRYSNFIPAKSLNFSAPNWLSSHHFLQLQCLTSPRST